MAAPGLSGMQQVLANLNREIAKMKSNTAHGLTEAAAFLFHDMDTTAPKIPIDTGNLRSSWVANLLRSSYTQLSIRFGFTANYALWVHENVDANFAGDQARIKYTKSGKVTAKTKKYLRREGAGAKFMEASLNRNHDEILRILAKNIKL